MKIYVVLAWLSIGVAFTAKAEPLVTISCEKPEGSSITYGVLLKERLDALAQEQPEPVNPTLRGPTKNEYQGKPTFVIDSIGKKLRLSGAKCCRHYRLPMVLLFSSCPNRFRPFKSNHGR